MIWAKIRINKQLKAQKCHSSKEDQNLRLRKTGRYILQNQSAKKPEKAGWNGGWEYNPRLGRNSYVWAEFYQERGREEVTTVREVEMAAKQIKDNKAPDNDDLSKWYFQNRWQTSCILSEKKKIRWDDRKPRSYCCIKKDNADVKKLRPFKQDLYKDNSI